MTAADTMVTRIDEVLQECEASQSTSWDSVVAAEIAALAELRLQVGEEWPLPLQLKDAINVGPVAAKNIADWNPELAESLMKLDYALRHGAV
jgi:hypothetical protein